MAGRYRQDAGVYFVDILLLGGGIFLLYNRLNLPLVVTDNPAITVGVVHIHGQQGQVAVVQVTDHGFQGIFSGQRNIAIEYQYPGVIRQVRQGLGHGMAGTQLFGLEHPVHRVVMQRRPYLVRAMADHCVNFLRAQLLCGVDHMVQHGLAGYRVQYLRQGGFHP